MRRFWCETLKGMLIVWIAWSSLLSSYEMIRLKIPMTMYLYEEEAKEVLSGTKKKIEPKDLYLDFAGNIEV